MSVSLREVIEAAGYDLLTKEDALWLLSQQNNWDELVEEAEDRIEEIEEIEKDNKRFRKVGILTLDEAISIRDNILEKEK